MEREIKIYTARSYISAIFYGIALGFVIAENFYEDIEYGALLAFLIGLVFQFRSERRAKYDTNYRKPRFLKYDDNSIKLGKLQTYDFKNLSDITIENDRLILKAGGLPIKYDVYETESNSVNDLIERFRNYKHKNIDPDYFDGSDISYAGKTMRISIARLPTSLDLLDRKVKNIEKQVVIDSYILHFPDGTTEEYSKNPLTYHAKDIHNKMLKLTPGGAI